MTLNAICGSRISTLRERKERRIRKKREIVEEEGEKGREKEKKTS